MKLEETYLISLFRAQPDRRRLLAAHHQINVVLRPQTMRRGGEETVRIRRQVHSGKLGLEVQHRTNEGRVLMTEPVMLLPRPCRGLNIVETSARLPPLRLAAHLDELGVLHHHGLDDAEEGFVRREETRATSKGVTLHQALAGMFGKDLDDATAMGRGGRVPLEVATT